MVYVQVSVPERDLPAVYELLLGRSGSDVAAIANGGNSISEIVPDDAVVLDEATRRMLAAIHRDVSEGGRRLLHALGPDERGPYDELEKELGFNAAAAQGSITKQSLKQGLPFEIINVRRAGDGSMWYSIRPEIAAFIAELG
jgi:hypothetical protein